MEATTLVRHERSLDGAIFEMRGESLSLAAIGGSMATVSDGEKLVAIVNISAGDRLYAIRPLDKSGN